MASSSALALPHPSTRSPAAELERVATARLVRPGRTEPARIIQAAAIAAAEKLTAAKHAFATSPESFYAAKYWVGDTTFTWSATIQPGVRPSAALRDMLLNPKQYQFDCATGSVIARYLMVLEIVGDATFDRLCPKLRIGPSQHDGLFDRFGEKSGDRTPAGRDFLATLQPGTAVYFSNPDVSREGFRAGWQGEHAIYLGKDDAGVARFFAHPFGIVTEEEIVRSLNGYRRPNAQTSAYLMTATERLKPELIAERSKP